MKVCSKLLFAKKNFIATDNISDYRIELGVLGKYFGDAWHCFIGIRVSFNLRKRFLRKLK